MSTDKNMVPFSTMVWYQSNACTECRHDAAAHTLQDDGRYACTATVVRRQGGMSFSGSKGSKHHPGLPPSITPGAVAYTYPCTCTRGSAEKVRFPNEC